jgi:hypothetical protein
MGSLTDLVKNFSKVVRKPLRSQIEIYKLSLKLSCAAWGNSVSDHSDE